MTSAFPSGRIGRQNFAAEIFIFLLKATKFFEANGASGAYDSHLWHATWICVACDNNFFTFVGLIERGTLNLLYAGDCNYVTAYHNTVSKKRKLQQ